MEAIETTAHFNERGEMTIDNMPVIKNRNVKLLFLFEAENDNDFYKLSATGLAKAYSEDEPDYNVNEVREPNTEYKK